MSFLDGLTNRMGIAGELLQFFLITNGGGSLP